LKALVVGGTGPTGPAILHGLERRGYEPVILHRGSHETDLVADYEHVHADPHFVEQVTAALQERTFDLVVVTYGRLRSLVEDLGPRTGRMVTVGGTAYLPQRWSRPADESAARDLSNRLISRIALTEDTIWAHAERTGLALTHIRYPYLYGPRQLAPREWSIIRRILDGRRTIPVVDGGLSLESRAYSVNAAHGVLLAVDRPEAAAGQTYHVADETTPTDAERAHAVARAMGAEIELIDYPADIGRAASFWFAGRSLEAVDRPYPPADHILLDTSRIRRDLGYADVVGFEEAMQETVDWYVAHSPEPGGDHERRLGDGFDYAAEDAYAEARRAFDQACRSIPFHVAPLLHAYDHPKETAVLSASQ
jgi:nucleoside-diphosphate-sugar epimerase